MFVFAVHFSYALFLGFLLASAVLVDADSVHPSPKLPNNVWKRTESNTTCNGDCWAGVSWELGNGTFYSVAGTFNVPEVWGSRNSDANVWIGIDGDTCSTGLLVGVVCTVTDKDPTYYAQWLWLYDWDAMDWNNFTVPISAGDNIAISIALFNTTAASVLVNNLSNNRSDTMYLESTHPLCGQNAAWFLQSGSHTLAEFTPVTFTNGVAGGQGNDTYGFDGATILEKAVDGQNLTYVVVESDSTSTWMTISHV